MIFESNLSTHVTPEMLNSAFEWANRNNNGKGQAQVAMEAPKTLQEGCSTYLVAALDPSIEGMPADCGGSRKMLTILGSSGGLCCSSDCAGPCKGEGKY